MALKRQPVLDGTYGAPAAEDKPTTEQRSAAAVETKVDREPALPNESQRPVDESTPTEQILDVPAAAPDRTERVAKADRAASVERPTPLRTVAKNRRAQTRVDELARTAVEESFRSAKRKPKEWGSAPIRIATTVKDRLAARRALDEEAYGVKFAETHYMDAALARVPEDPAVAIDWVERYLDGFPLKAPATVGTTGRVRTSTIEHLEKVTRAVRMKAGYGFIGHLQTAALERLLDSLDRWDAENQSQVVDLDEA
ncbi:hypothetical protein [Nocardia sp. NPDC050793]|uniref:hypothetical protein n=1 Tax=Nocardia sp. NPDC050793 TaxID=3155159 RepID=UPI003406B071